MMSIRAMQGAVYGSEFPWVEAIVLNAGAVCRCIQLQHHDVFTCQAQATTIEYGKIFTSHPKIRTETPKSFAEKWLRGNVQEHLWDFAIAFSSFEHSGLGRYGDRLNPFADLEAMAQVKNRLDSRALQHLTCTTTGMVRHQTRWIVLFCCSHW